MNAQAQFQHSGFVTLDGVVSESCLGQIDDTLPAVALNRAGSRALLAHPSCKDVLVELRSHPLLSSLLPAVAIQCTLFHKDSERNWLVALHCDKSVPVAKACPSVGWGAWSQKEGVVYAQPPFEFMSSLVAVRVNLDADSLDSGALCVVPNTHRGCNEGQVRPCIVGRGGVLLMRPTLLHRSSKLRSGSCRVLHFLFGPKELPGRLRWAYAA